MPKLTAPSLCHQEDLRCLTELTLEVHSRARSRTCSQCSAPASRPRHLPSFGRKDAQSRCLALRDQRMVKYFLKLLWTEEGTTRKRAGSTSIALSTTDNRTSAWFPKPFSLRVAVSVAGIPAPTLFTAAIAAGQQTSAKPAPSERHHGFMGAVGQRCGWRELSSPLWATPFPSAAQISLHPGGTGLGS